MWKPLFAMLARAFAAGAASHLAAAPLAAVAPEHTLPSRRARSGHRVGVATARATPRALGTGGPLAA